MLKPGDDFPDFELQDQEGNTVKQSDLFDPKGRTFSPCFQDGNTVKKSDLLGQKAIVYFYPKDDTSGCTAESCGFRDTLPKFKGARVIGVSPDSVKSHQKFKTKYDLNFTLLADPERKLIEPLGLWVEKTLYGKKYMGVARTTFLLS